MIQREILRVKQIDKQNNRPLQNSALEVAINR